MNNFEANVQGGKTKLFKLKNKNGIEVTITNFGGKIVSILVPDKEGQYEDVVLGYDNIENYINGNPYFGAIVGRHANRIARGEFTLDGKTYYLNKNAGNTHLHGGDNGFHNVFWDAVPTTLNGNEALILHYLSRDGEENYPGNLKVTVIYRLSDSNELHISLYAETDKPTIVNLTNHPFFNLAGAGNGDILHHKAYINADKFTPMNEDMVPTGELKDVSGTPFDFRKMKTIGKDIDKEDEQLKIGNGYDHNFVLNKTSDEDISLAARILEPFTGRIMEVWTDQPGLQFYTGNFLDGSDVGKGGKPYERRSAFCLEAQHFPDAPHHPNFPSTTLRPGEHFSHNCIYKFLIKQYSGNLLKVDYYIKHN